ncbi:MAG: AmmeMemoRadiSam system radical SAM enzyme [Candidatus Omnitrophica bacterium]|jgi:pyruvate formate lyase activating enzyme|nr:AmmeMemoRadiSam system radical SAM enzyme [Candidatus Omnitrophota bacterium]
MKKEAILYERLDSNNVHCFLCAHNCRIADADFGICGMRQNNSGVLYTFAYDQVVAANVDPVEKKPLFHFLPGSQTFSVATMGCNFKCSFCQNWQISQINFRDSNDPATAKKLSPGEIVDLALQHECRSISYTYTEPTIFFEYALEIMKLAKKKGLYNLFVTNGFMSRDCLELARGFLDAANVDLKFFDDSFYQKICGARLKPVLDSIRFMHEIGIWVEVTTLLIPKQNDSPEQLKGIADFLSGVDKDMPWHISAFHPDYKLSHLPPTDLDSLEKAYKIGKDALLRYVYVGNLRGIREDTFCPSCGKKLILRHGFSVEENKISSGRCSYCNGIIKGIFNE